MRYLLLTLVFFCSHSFLFAQTLEGKVYNSKSVVKNIKVLNKTQNRLTVTDNEGNFSIEAKVNDTISFKSVFYHPKEVVLTKIHFDSLNVFEIEKVINELDEVEVQTEMEEKFDSISFYSTIESEKKTLSKKPLMSSGDNLMPTLDLKQLYKDALKLFKRKKVKIYLPISYEQMDSLFNKSALFDKDLLTKDFKIPEDKIKMFYEFCAAKGISSELLIEDKKMQLLEQLVVNSQLFLILLEEYGDGNTKED